MGVRAERFNPENLIGKKLVDQEGKVRGEIIAHSDERKSLICKGGQTTFAYPDGPVQIDGEFVRVDFEPLAVWIISIGD